MKRAFQWYSLFTTFGMLLVLLMGSIVTKTGSGDGCGNSWPLCYGQVLPSAPKLETMIEYSHRIVSGWLGILVIILAVWAWKKYGHIKGMKFLACVAVFFIVLQGLLGAAAVIWSQSSAVLALHFGFSLISFASVLLIAVLSFEKQDNPFVMNVSSGFKKNIYLLFIYLYLVVYTGALVRHTESSLGCTGFPLCNGEWLPELGGAAGIQFLHRIAAFILFIWILLSAAYAHKHYREDRNAKIGFILASLFITLQAASGAIVVLSNLNLFAALSHGVIISCLFGTLSFLVMAAYRKT
ncbi:heme A synthase [Fictibacillus iocasae]|uniref:Heme A synthase n=1 Tax=Fictibacillus iocasae TaxID=2715437 RepID=A0ABW2NQK7_9BACL